MKVLTAVSLILLIAPSVAHAANAAPNLAGAWRLVETRQRMADGSTRPDPDLGAHPAGYMIYDPSGRMCTLFNDTDPPGWAGAKPTDTELRRMFNHSVLFIAPDMRWIPPVASSPSTSTSASTPAPRTSPENAASNSRATA